MNLFWCTRTGKGLASPPPNSTESFSPHSCLSSHNTTDLRAKVTQKLVTSDVQPKDGFVRMQTFVHGNVTHVDAYKQDGSGAAYIYGMAARPSTL